MIDATKGKIKTGRADMQSYTTSGEPFTNLYHETIVDGWDEQSASSFPLTVARAEGEQNKAIAAWRIKNLHTVFRLDGRRTSRVWF